MANNPLAKANSIGFQNYYTPSLYGLVGMSANTFMIRPVLVTPRLVIRATIPVVTTPAMKADPVSGLGDINIFATYVWNIPKSYTDIGIGPIVVLPSAGDSVLGAGKYQVGAAFIAGKEDSVGNGVDEGTPGRQRASDLLDPLIQQTHFVGGGRVDVAELGEAHRISGMSSSSTRTTASKSPRDMPIPVGAWRRNSRGFRLRELPGSIWRLLKSFCLVAPTRETIGHLRSLATASSRFCGRARTSHCPS